MNEGLRKAILEGDDNAALSALKSTHNLNGLLGLWHHAYKAGQFDRANMIRHRMDEIRGT